MRPISLLSLLVLWLATACSEESQPIPPPPPLEGKTSSAPAPAPVAALASPPAVVATPVVAEPEYVVLDTFEIGNNVFARSLLVEADKNILWVGTSVGVHAIDLKTQMVQKTFTREHGLANEYVFAMGQDSEGSIWFGTNAGGTSRYKNGEWKTFFPMHGLADYWVYSFANHPDGSLWIGTWAGVNRVDLKTLTFQTFVKELVNEWVYDIAVDAKSRLWFGTEGGVSRFDGHEWVSWTHQDGLGAANSDNLPASTNTGLGTRTRHDLGTLTGGQPTYNPNYVFSLVVTPEDHVWAGTWGGGISHFDGQKWQNTTTQDGLPGNIIFSMIQDAHGDLWAGTENGIARYHQGRWQPFLQNYMLRNTNIYTLAVTPEGDIWAGAQGKVVHIGQASNKTKKEIK